MNWAALSSVFLLATFKFMFSAVPGVVGNVPFLYTYLAMISGGIISSGLFYFMAEIFMKMSHKRAIKKRQELERKGLPIKVKKKFTRINKLIVKIKLKIGIYGIAFWAPLFLSIPIGSAVVAKFYGKKLVTFPLMVVGILVNGLIVVYLTYIFE